MSYRLPKLFLSSPHGVITIYNRQADCSCRHSTEDCHGKRKEGNLKSVGCFVKRNLCTYMLYQSNFCLLQILLFKEWMENSHFCWTDYLLVIRAETSIPSSRRRSSVHFFLINKQWIVDSGVIGEITCRIDFATLQITIKMWFYPVIEIVMIFELYSV